MHTGYNGRPNSIQRRKQSPACMLQDVVPGMPEFERRLPVSPAVTSIFSSLSISPSHDVAAWLI